MRRDNDLSSYLCRAAKAANCLAHQLNGTNRVIGFQVKSELVSALLVAFEALIRVNGVRDGILGLDILTDPPARLHIPLSALRPEAQEVACRLAICAPAVGPLGARIKPEQRQSLNKLTSRPCKVNVRKEDN